ncbi:glucose-methanol-choline oxidoreductase [Penicillium alfredii]|uniref:Glucose-methanol-choline oxidoreductase n=1 Tax=Penicillium alfredii TaxID=1506179 RepID=A0A9W9FSH8_9EURO|nr:glucose-methanol-choline oxidoreductase [Penicillium alfredii]KAJ5105514.1 glucose-methanol-choline oxidoreductase [Penicillium alfredii]
MAESHSLEADYVIVGGGTAGLVLASRLSEDPSKTVVVLEAGKNMIDDPRVRIPGLWTTLMGSEADWQLESVPQQAALGNRVIKMTQAKLLGGGSGINGQAFIAATREGIDAWSKLGATGWTWEILHDYYKKSYTLQLPDPATREHIGVSWIDDRNHGSSGPLKISFPATIQNPLARAWVDTFQKIGRGISADPFSGSSIGGYSNMAAVDGEAKTRSYAATEYGLPAMQRPGVHIVTEALVHRILFDPPDQTGVTATGVEAVVQGQMLTVKATKEVIVTAGALNTPKILELSGIGNETILAQHNIPVVVHNSNVGENLQDHLMTGISFETVDGVPTADPLLRQEPEAMQAAVKMHAEHNAGPMTIGGVQSSAYMPVQDYHGIKKQGSMREHMDRFLSNPTGRDQAIRDILAQPDSPTCSMFMFLAQANLHENGKSFVGHDHLPGNYFSLGLIQSMPFSRGSVHISSANPEDQQTVDPCFFSHPLDQDIMARNLMDVERMHRHEPLAQYVKPNGRRNHPDAFLTDLESAKKYLRDTATTTYHPSGTAAMLPLESGGVVDDSLRVYGTTNVRVCDASIMPLIPAANIMTTVYAVAERTADIIKSGL